MENNQNHDDPQSEAGGSGQEKRHAPYSSGQQQFYMPPPQGSSFETPVRRKHSGPGIASFIVSLAMYMLCVVLLVVAVATVSDYIDPATGSIDQGSLEAMLQKAPSISLLGLGFMAAAVGQLIALVLGIIGIAQKERSKVFAILGTVFGGLFVGLAGIIMLLGLAAASV